MPRRPYMGREMRMNIILDSYNSLFVDIFQDCQVYVVLLVLPGLRDCLVELEPQGRQERRGQWGIPACQDLTADLVKTG